MVKPGSVFEPDHPVLGFEAHPVDRDEPVPGFHVGAGCLFAPGQFVQAFPYDPYFYFHGEEQALAARIFTHGWDIFHVPGQPVYHLYNTPNSVHRRGHCTGTRRTTASASTPGGSWNNAPGHGWPRWWRANRWGSMGSGANARWPSTPRSAASTTLRGHWRLAPSSR